MIGITGYGAYIPKYRIKAEEIAKANNADPSIPKSILIEEKSVPAADEDSLTMGVEAARIAIKDIDKSRIGAIYCGSESKVYAVKPNATIVGEALGIGPNYSAADLEFACKAGTAALQICLGLVKAGFIESGLAIGSDTAQAAPGDILEYSAAAGAAAFVVGKEKVMAELEGTCSYATDTPDFWRRQLQKFPSHAEQFTGTPAYFKHVVACTRMMMEKLDLTEKDIDHFAFHTPNGKFPLKAAKLLGLPKEKIEKNLLVSKIGNTYSAASLLVFTHILDQAKPGERILVTSFGSGAGSDSFVFKVTDQIKKIKQKTTQSYVDEKEYVGYAAYSKCVGLLR
ncbi:MAG TPA: hydroxymethylglutaryl-CoA synthase [Candidatus Nanoarchaeia archaeon]|nr:hydroxymethylglutaryl-CoA synthase [Candidatus Nanoarchaeia archaeon]